jgi:ribose transport system ATP-binding protein
VTALHVENLSKTFGGARALRNIELSVERGEIHGVLGQNGCGKSTLVKLLAGFHEPDPGSRVHLFGKSISLPLRGADPRTMGLSFVHQNLGLVPTLSVLENLRITALTSKHRWHINWRKEKQLAEQAFTRIGVAIDPGARIADLAPVDRAMVAIARAMENIREAQLAGGVPGLLVLDEPTPFLPQADVQRLFSLLRRIASQGASVILISHDVDEIKEITDRCTVLRDGEVAGRFVTSSTSRDSIVALIVGRRIDAHQAHSHVATGAGEGVAITNLTGPSSNGVNIEAGAGEIVGLTGLAGSGFERVLYHIFGAAPATSGEIRLGSQLIDMAGMTPARAMRAGISLLPGDRQGASGVGSLPMVDNLFLGDLRSFFRAGKLRWVAMTGQASQTAMDFDVRPRAPTLKLSAFSGGNAQKVLLAKWLRLNPRLLLLDEPTQGVDVGARQQLWTAIRTAANRGTVVLCASSDHEQLAQLCDRVLVFSRGRVVAGISGPALTKETIAARCYG